MTERAKRAHGTGMEFHLVMSVAFIAFFIGIAAKRLLPWNWGRDGKSIFSAAKTAAYSSVPFAFM
jgi:hypothetical protein